MRPDAADSDGGLLLTLDRGLRVLNFIADKAGQATARTLSEALQINLSTCYQILRTLQARHYAERLPGGRYCLGPRVFDLADQRSLTSAPPPDLLNALRDLHRTVGESVYLTLRRGTTVPLVAFFEGTGALRVRPLAIGYSDHLHARASGKCFLAFTDPVLRENYISRDSLVPLTSATITDWRTLTVEFGIIRSQGYAVEDQEFSEGVACIGVVLLSASGAACGAIGLALPAASLERRRDQVVAAALETGKVASSVLGYEGPYPPPP